MAVPGQPNPVGRTATGGNSGTAIPDLVYYQTLPEGVMGQRMTEIGHPVRLVIAGDDGILCGEWSMPRALSREEVEDFWVAQGNARRPIKPRRERDRIGRRSMDA